MSWLCANGCGHEFDTDTAEPRVCDVCRLKDERDDLRDERHAMREWLAMVGELQSYDAWRRGVLEHRGGE